MNELISIVVPVYNVEKYLGTCVESILKQTYSNIEVILVDDGSTDCSGKMCDHYMGQDERIKVIHKKNGGLSDARNKGIIQAEGEYITFIDSDDVVSSDCICLITECKHFCTWSGLVFGNSIFILYDFSILLFLDEKLHKILCI